MKRIFVFAPMGTLYHQTGILNAVHCFAEAGYRVEVLTIRNRAMPIPSFASGSVVLHYMPWTFNSYREPRILVTVLFSLWAGLSIWRSRPIIFAGGIRGLFAAYLYSLFRQTRIINYQAELYVDGATGSLTSLLFKYLERVAARRSELTIEHDEERKKILTKDLGLEPERVIVVPNAPRGPATLLRSSLLHDRLSLDKSEKILLCPGSIGDAFDTSTAMRLAPALPRGWRCVVHSAQPRMEKDPDIDKLRRLDPKGLVKFSLDPVPYEEINDLLGSATVGLVLYSSQVGMNISTIGLSSGKLSHFLKLGIPVLVSPLSGLASFVHEYGVGEVLDSPKSVEMLLEKISADMKGYQERALRCFDQNLSYERTFRPVIDAVRDTGNWRM